MALDKRKIARQDTARIEVLDPVTRSGTDCWVTIYGPSSEVFEAASDRLRKRRLALLRRYKREEDIPNEAGAQSMREFLADVTANIEGYMDGETPIPFSRQMAAADFYQDTDIAVQVSTEIGNRANFTKG